ncbi:hypothetical protein IID22_04780 [Patescibacteria group bacterium]|nr:hypothetical protein [Patescibacteria group bacterium]
MTKESEISERAWLLREEKGDSELALTLWWGLYAGYQLEKNWPKAIDALVDISIAYRGAVNKEPLYTENALITIKLAKQISENHGVPPRKDFGYHMGNAQIVVGDYQGGIESFVSYLEAAELNPEERANVNVKIGLARAVVGQKDEGIKLLKESIEALENPTSKNVYQEKDVNAIWKLGAMMKLARVLDDRSEAKRLVQDALRGAKEKNLGARVKQAQALLDELSKGPFSIT